MIPPFILAIENEEDREFMVVLYENYNRLVYQQIHDILGNDNDVQDIQQDVYLKFIQNEKIDLLRSLDRDRRINYVIVSAQNAARSYLQRKGRITFVSLDEERDGAEMEDDSFELQIQREEDLACLAKAWPKLPETTRFWLEGRYVLSKSYEELAQERNIEASSARTAVTRARKTAKTMLEAEMNGEPLKRS